MGPAQPPAAQAMQVFADPAIRAQIRQWHIDEVPFLDMIDRIGLSGSFVGEIRNAIAGLSAAEVGIIRKAMLAAIDAAGDSEGACFPIACTLQGVTGPVQVSALDKNGEPWARVVAAR